MDEVYAPTVLKNSQEPRFEENITDEENLVKKSVEKEKYSRVVNILKEYIGATISIKRILDLRVNLTVREFSF